MLNSGLKIIANLMPLRSVNMENTITDKRLVDWMAENHYSFVKEIGIINGDLNDIRTECRGHFHISQVHNAPQNTGNWFLFNCYVNHDNNCIQEVVKIPAGDIKLHRILSNNEWSDWQFILRGGE